MSKPILLSKQRLWAIPIAGAALFILAFFLGFWWNRSSKQESNKETRISKSQYKFINPLLECADLDSISNRKIEEMKVKIKQTIEKNSSDIRKISVYFRDLNNGPWFGLNEKEYFTPGSLLKLPLMISIFKKAESDKDFLKKGILYEGGKSNFPQYFKPERELTPGKTYTIEELVELMIEDSNNDAALLLTQIISKEELDESYKDLGIDIPEYGKDYFMQVRGYASFLRILYNATYLNKELSEKTLQILSRTAFKDGLVRGVPPEISVSHKFGERVVLQENNGENFKQLHDCGIVYDPQNPYLLCVMTIGYDIAKLSSLIYEISKTVYENVNL